MKLVTEEVLSMSLDRLRPYARDNPEFYGRPGREHYALLAYLSTFFSGKDIIDIGTHRGDSALALSYNASNRVTSFDIEDKVPDIKRYRSNVVFRIANLFDRAVREQHRRLLLDSALISIDVDPHSGEMEAEFVSWLEEEGYDGVVVLDDIWYFKPMRDKLWAQIRSGNKLDVTPLGHWSGTGLVSFSEPLRADIPSPTDTRNWTVVTGYFDLTQEPDATPELRARPPEHYLDEHAAGTLAADQNLVVFTEPKFEEKIWSMRPKWLHDRTRVVLKHFGDFPLSKYRDDIIRNRAGGACQTDPRNTASYYLFCMARYAMLRDAIRDKAFGSDRFAWMNICMERMGSRNLAYLTDALSVQREQFSTCYIDYARPETVTAFPLFFGPGGCSVPNLRASCVSTTFCSGFFTGSDRHMKSVCELMDDAFKRALDAGYGHADEQIMAIVHAERPSLFDWYIGDYQEMITNYAVVRDRPEQPLMNLIGNSRRANDVAVCGRAAGMLLRSYKEGHVWLSEGRLAELLGHCKWVTETATESRT